MGACGWSPTEIWVDVAGRLGGRQMETIAASREQLQGLVSRMPPLHGGPAAAPPTKPLQPRGLRGCAGADGSQLSVGRWYPHIMDGIPRRASRGTGRYGQPGRRRLRHRSQCLGPGVGQRKLDVSGVLIELRRVLWRCQAEPRGPSAGQRSAGGLPWDRWTTFDLPDSPRPCGTETAVLLPWCPHLLLHRLLARPKTGALGVAHYPEAHRNASPHHDTPRPQRP